MVVEQNGLKFGPRGGVFSVYRVLLTLKWLRSFWVIGSFRFRKTCVSKTAGRRAKQGEIWASGVSIQCTQDIFDTLVIKVILGSFGAFFNKPLHVSQMAGRRAKWIEIWASGVSIQCTQGTFDTSVMKVIPGSFGAFSIFEKNCISKRAGRRAKRSEIWASWVGIQCTQSTFET